MDAAMTDALIVLGVVVIVVLGYIWQYDIKRTIQRAQAKTESSNIRQFAIVQTLEKEVLEAVTPENAVQYTIVELGHYQAIIGKRFSTNVTYDIYIDELGNATCGCWDYVSQKECKHQAKALILHNSMKKVISSTKTQESDALELRLPKRN